jgi:ABC-type antimicrobial peptide transport system permease subunit
MKRAKEIGLRKTVGAHRYQLIFQFLGESVMVAFVAMAISLLMVDLMLPPFNTLIQKNLQLNFQSFHGIIPTCIAGTLITGLLAGSYPAIFLSSFQAAKVLKGTLHTSSGGGTFRKVLVVLQFCVSIIMISGTLIVYSQIQFIRNKNLGFEKDKIINIHRVSNDYDVFKNTLLSHGNIKGVAGTAEHPSFIQSSGAGFSWQGKNPEDLLLLHYQTIGHDYVETMGMKMMMGRSFSKNNISDTLGIIINEEAMKLMNLEKPLGEIVNYNYTKKNYTIIGVVKDFHFKPIHTKIEPLILFLSSRNEFSNVMVRAEGNAVENIKMMETEWKKLNPEKPFEYSFLNEDFDNLYRTETQTGTIFKYFAGLAIIISCLGLFGLASFTVEQRNKEFGIRKVFGASISRLYYIASRDFIILVIISCFISLPFAWLWMKQWLSAFAYRIDLGPVAFVIAGLLAILIALLTVSYQALKVGRINPAKTLRNEQ